MKVLNLYSGIGGNRKLWKDVEVTAIEYDENIAKIYQDFFPNDKVIVTDAHQYLLEHYKEFDFIWSSPPCPTHSRIRWMASKAPINPHDAVFPDMTLYQEIIFLDNYFNGKYLVENVIPFYEPLIVPTKKLHRHLYWSNFIIGIFNVDDERKHMNIKSNSTVYGFNLSNHKVSDRVKCLRNMVDPSLGLYILNCARNIITKQNEKQIDLF